MKTIDGPLGPFWIPESAHPRTAEVCEQLSRAVFEGEYDHAALPTFAEEEPPLVLDLGGGWGAFTCWALAKWPGSDVYAYEPHAEAADVFEENLKAELREGRAKLSRLAVTIDPKPRMNGCEDWGAHHLAPADDACARPVAGKHPQYLPPCDVLKMDVEGAEVEVLEHYRHLALVSALLVEYHSFEKRSRVFEMARAAGFVCVKQPDESASYGVTVWVRS